MKLKEAERIGRGCLLETLEECVNNIIFHACNLFVYTEMAEELDELTREAKEAGLQFAACGHCALERGAKRCYACAALEDASTS